MGRLATFLVACLFLSSYIPLNEGFNVERSRRSPDGTLEGLHSSWLTVGQLQQIKQLQDSRHDFRPKYLQFFNSLDASKKKSVGRQIVEKCYEWVKPVASNDELIELSKLHHTNHDACKRKIKEYLGRVPEAQKSKIEKNLGVCDDVWYKSHIELGQGRSRTSQIGRSKRDHHDHGHEAHHGGHKLEDYFQNHLSWLTDEQKETLKSLKAEGKTRKDLQDKVFEFYEALSGEAKTKATELLQAGCKELISMVIGKEKADQVKALKEGGATNEDIQKKVKEFISEVTDEHKKKIADEYEEPCKKVFGVASRKKRDAPSKLDEALNTHLSWLTDDQKESLKTLKAEGKPFADLQKKVLDEFYTALPEDKKNEAKNQMQEGCRSMIKEIAGDEAAAELKKLRESGASKADIEAKIAEYMDKLTDVDKKQQAVKYAPACKRVFDLESKRRKRDEGQGKLEEAFKTHLSWLGEDQKQTLRSLKNEGKEFKDLQAKVFEFYEGLSGEDKNKATELLKGGCKALMTEILGEEKAGELKKLKESGASNDDLKAKAQEFIGALTDEAQKEKAKQYGNACEKIFGVSSRKKRDHHDHHGHGIDHEARHKKLDEYFKTHLSWLTDAQKQELKDLCMADKTDAELQAKVFEYYEALTGEAKEKATQLMQDGCRAFIKSLVGEEKAGELKKLKESGASNEDMEKKIKELIEGLDDPEKKKKAAAYGPACKKIFGVATRKKRSTVDTEKFEEALKTHLSWLSDDQKTELKSLKAEGKNFEDLQKKVFEYHAGLSGEAKNKATELLKGGCRDLIKDILGEEKANELKKLKETGASKKDMQSKAVEFMDGITDPAKKEKATKYAPSCFKIFELEDNARVKRDHKIEEDKFEEALKTHLSWLSDAQKEELKTLKSEGKSFEEVQKKVFEFYEALSGEAKQKATNLLQEGCRSVIKELVGDEKAEELKKLRESGASKEDIKKKIIQLMDELTDPEKKEKAVKFAGGCQKVFEIDNARVKRDAPSKLEEALNTHLSWLTNDQKETIKTLKAEGKPFADLQKKVLDEFYTALPDDKKNEAKNQMQEGCRSVIKEIAGDEAAAELKKLRESGASKADIEAKIAEYMDKLTDEDKKQQAVKYAPACKKIFDLEAKRRKRDEGDAMPPSDARKKRDTNVELPKLEEALKTHLSWLSDEQKEEVKTLAKGGKTFEDINNKVFEFYGKLEGEAKDKAKELMQGGCRALIKELAGDQVAEDLKKLRESGASKAEITKKITDELDKLTDEDKKQKALKYAPACQKIFDLDSSTRLKRDSEDEQKRYINLLGQLTQLSEELPWNKTEAEQEFWIRQKIEWFFDSSTDDYIFERLQSSCKFLLGNSLGIKYTSRVPKEIKIKEILKHIEMKNYSNQTLKAVAVFGNLCKKTAETIESKLLSGNENYDYTIQDQIVDLYEKLPKLRKMAIRLRWKAQCVSWIVSVTDDEERDRLKMLMRNKKHQILKERINLLLVKFNDTMRTKVSHYRPLCEKLFEVA